MIECPHCHSTVLPMADGRCPACGRDPARASASDQRSFTFAFDEALPPVCMACGRETENQVRVDATKGTTTSVSSWVVYALVAAVFGWIAGALAALSAVDRSATHQGRFSRSIPLCPTCASNGAPTPDYVDHPQRRATFLVHEDFRKRARGA